jgi:hypothetical protein
VRSGDEQDILLSENFRDDDFLVRSIHHEPDFALHEISSP